MTSIKKEYIDHIKWLNEAGELHREDGPAIECADGSKKYYYKGKLLKFVKTDKQLRSYIRMRAFD